MSVLSNRALRRRPVPADYHEAQLTLRGVTPLLLNSGEADRDSELFRDFTHLSQKRGKSLDDEARLRLMEWALRAYIDDTVGPYIPGKNIKEMLRSAATKYRKGEDIKRSLAVADFRIPILYDGPREQEILQKDEAYRYLAMVSNAGQSKGRVVRTRPKFDDWTLVTTLAWDPEDLDEDLIVKVVKRSEKYGLGDYRPEFGAFNAELGEVQTSVSDFQVDGIKPVDLVSEQAYTAFLERIRKSS
jgi:hypothetical protein